MRSYLELVPQYAKVHKKKNKTTILCIVIAVCLVTAIFGLADMAIQCQKVQFIKDDGNWHIIIKNLDEKSISEINSRVDIAHHGRAQVIDNGEFKSKEIWIQGLDEDLSKQLGLEIIKGRYPVGENETLIDVDAVKSFNLKIGDFIKIKLADGRDKNYKIVGEYSSVSRLRASDKHGLILSILGTQAIKKTEIYDNYYITFKDRINIRKATSDIKNTFNLSDKQIGKNEKLLSIIGQGDSDYSKPLYLTAGGLFILVLIASIIMIYNSFNMGVIERIKFFGLLRCLGASKLQVKKFVVLESLVLSLKAIPLGLLLGSTVTIVSSIFLKYVNTELFGSMPTLKVSFIGIVFGIIVGFLTVILSAIVPAKKASRVSPLSAIRGNLMFKEILTNGKARKIANARTSKIDASMGINHAFSRKKSFILMTSSFVLSIVLFLGFSVFIDFMYQALKPIKPEASHISIVDPDFKSVLTKEDINEISNIKGIKKVYSRMMTDVEATYNNKEAKSQLISYEKNQFNWAKKYLVKGQINEERLDSENIGLVEEGHGFNIGDKIYIKNGNSKKEIEIVGILSSIPFDVKDKYIGNIITSENTFTNVTGIKDYIIIDTQVDKDAHENLVQNIRSVLDDNLEVRDKRQGNLEATNSFHTMAIFIYGFVFIIAIISMFNIINSMNISVTSRINYYGIMRAIGMSNKQLRKMVIVESSTYAVSGCLLGSVLGLILHRYIFVSLITSKFHIEWQIPFDLLFIIVVTMIIITLLSVRKPIKKICELDIIDAVNAQ
ncbi:FtsX-like permease family protein [Clostridioides difficile]|nr:FtsX-like permease family protein [Clostridioides difficile]